MRKAMIVLALVAGAGCTQEDLRGPLLLSVHDFTITDNGTAAFVLRIENPSDRALVNISMRGQPAEATHGPARGRITDMPHKIPVPHIPAAQMSGVFDPDARLEPGSAWSQGLNATFDEPPGGTEGDPYAFEWHVMYGYDDGPRWNWLHWTCHRTDGQASQTKGCYEWFEYFPD